MELGIHFYYPNFTGKLWMTLLILDIGLSMKAAASRSPPRSVAGAAMRHAQVFASAIPISSDTTVGFPRSSAFCRWTEPYLQERVHEEIRLSTRQHKERRILPPLRSRSPTDRLSTAFPEGHSPQMSLCRVLCPYSL